MIVYLNGEFVAEEAAKVSVFDRSFLYGDGLFETLRVFNGKPFRWQPHLDRLAAGAAFLGIPFGGSSRAWERRSRDRQQPGGQPGLTDTEIGAPPAVSLRVAVDRLVAENRMPDSVLRITLSRGIGMRGYSPRGALQPTLVMSLHPAPAANQAAPDRLITSRLRLSADDPLLRFKTANKLTQVLARSEADAAGADEALLLNNRGEVCEATSANVFWIEGRRLVTPPVNAGALPGITRSVVWELVEPMGLERSEDSGSPKRLLESDGVFLTLSSKGIVEVSALDGTTLKRSAFVPALQRAYAGLLERETA